MGLEVSMDNSSRLAVQDQGQPHPCNATAGPTVPATALKRRVSWDREQMKPVIVGTVVAAGLGLVMFAFMANASPYVDAAAAMRSKGDNLHVAGKIVPGTLVSSMGKAALG